jgi:hypothetical protein
MWEDVGPLLVRFFLSGPVLYIGLVMALDPAGFLRSLGMASVAIRNFENRLHGREQQEWWREMEPVPEGGAAHPGLRTVGWFLVATAFLHLAGILGPRI